MSQHRALLQPRSIALDAGAEPAALGRAIEAHLLARPPAGGLAIVGPTRNAGAADNVIAAARWSDLPFVPDLAVISGPVDAAVDALEQAGRRGVRTAILCTEDPDGRAPATPFKRALLAAARRHGCRFLGPGSAGLNLPAANLNASWMPEHPEVGRLALVAQSGTVTATVAGWARARGIGMSRLIAVGDEADIGIDAILDTLAADTQTRAILLHMQALADGRAFTSAARAVARVKPVLVLCPPSIPQPGESALDDDHEAVLDAVFARAGLLRVHDTREWFDAADSLLRPMTRQGGKLAVVTNGRGPSLVAAAAAAREGVLASLGDATRARLHDLLSRPDGPANPLTLARPAPADAWARALAALREDPAVASAVVIHAASPRDPTRADTEVSAIARAIAQAATGSALQVGVCWLGESPDVDSTRALASAGVAIHALPEQAVRAFVLRERHRHNQESLRQVPTTQRRRLLIAGESPAGPSQPAESALLTTDEAESATFLIACGMIWRALDGERATLDGPARAAVLAAFGIRAAAADDASAPALPLTLLLRNDPDFGRVIVLIAAGRHTVLLPPLNPELVNGPATSAAQHLRSSVGIDIPPEVIGDCAIRLSALAADLPEVVAARLVCVAFDTSGLTVRAEAIEVATPQPGEHPLVLGAYPRELEERVRLRDGREAVFRPIRIEDAPLYRAMLDRIPGDDLFLRFCNLYSDITQAIPTDLLANLVRFDYSRDMTFIAIAADDAGRPEAIGVADAFVSAGGEEAEFSILLRSDLGGTGLGRALMTKVIGYCRAKGVRTLFGLVLRRNARMLGLAKRLGFVRAAAHDDDDEDMVRVELAL